MSNTCIHYQYRDASNYKRSNRIVVKGKITFKQVQRYLDDGCFFIPSQVDMKDLQEEWGRIDPDLDHSWHELLEDDFTPTDATPTVEFNAAELLEKFKTVKWDEVTRFDELMSVARYEDEEDEDDSQGNEPGGTPPLRGFLQLRQPGI